MRYAVLAIMLVLAFGVASAYAQTTPTYGESQIGNTGCVPNNNDADFDAIAQCNASSGTGTFQKAPIFIGAVTSPPYASTSCGASFSGMMQWTGSAMQYCDGSSWDTIQTGAAAYDLSAFYPGAPPASAIVRVVSDRTASYPSNLTGSNCVAKEGATSSAVVTINKVHSGSSSSVGTATFAASGGSNETCSFTSSSGISLVAGDVVEFVFPATPDATLGDIAITLEGTHQ